MLSALRQPEQTQNHGVLPFDPWVLLCASALVLFGFVMISSASMDVALERNGTPIGVNDLHIAGHARSEGLTLVTNNLREFERVQALRLENWV